MLLGIQKEHVMKTNDQHTWLHEVATPAQKLELLDVMEYVVYKAQQAFEHCPTDFCFQNISHDCIVFGGVNRLIWRVDSGFTPDESYCTERFLDNLYNKD